MQTPATDSKYPSHLLIVDGMNLFRRVYEANPAPDSNEKVESALSASRSSLRRAYETHQPTHMAIALDAPGTTWRHELYPAYKAGRTPMPEALREGIDGLTHKLANHGWGRFLHPGFEADDTIGSLAAVACADGMEVTILSTDKDIVYLLTLGAKVYDHFSYTWRDEAWCLAKHGVYPGQMLDYLALTGDSSDGIPGVESVGAKTAAKLLAQHGTLENVLAAGAPGKVGEKLKAQADMARLSRKLTDLKLDLFQGKLNPDLIGRPTR